MIKSENRSGFFPAGQVVEILGEPALGAAAPTKVFLNNTVGWKFGVGDEVYFTFQMPRGWAAGTGFIFELHSYSSNTTADRYVRWQLDWMAVSIGESISAPAPSKFGTIDTGDILLPTTANQLTEIIFNDVNGDLADDDHILIKLSRIASVGTAPAAADNPVMIHLETHYTQDKLGEYMNYDHSAQLYFDESTAELPDLFKSAINWGVLDLKSSGNWSKLNFFFIGFTPNQTLSRTNLKNPSHKLNEMVTSGWNSNEWWEGNGSRYLGLNWNPSANGGNTYTQNNAGFTIMPAIHGQLNENAIPFGARQPSDFSDNYVSFSANNQYAAINGDQGTVSGPKSAGVITLTRDNSANFKAWRQGVLKNTMAVISKPLASIEWVGLAWNNNGTIGAFTTYNKLMLMAAHTGDVDVAALNNTIKGIIARLNGGYQMTTQTENIPGMPAMDSCTLGTLTASKIGLFGGYAPGEPSNTTNKWFTSTDSGANWTAEAVMPFRVAHALGGLRNDGFYWLFGYDPSVAKLFIMKLDTSTHIWTTVNGDLGAGDLAGLSYMQWGYLYNDEIYAAMSPDGGATVKLYKTSNGNNWSLVSTLPVAYAVNSSAYVDGNTIRFTGGCRYADPVMDNFVSNIYESTDGGVNWSIVRPLPANLQSAWPSYFKYNGDEFFLTGRNLAVTIDEGFIYRWNGSQWINTLMIELSGRHAVAHLVRNEGVYFANGYLYNDCYKMSF